MNQIIMEVPIEIPVETSLVGDNKVMIKIDARFIDLAIKFLRNYRQLQGKTMYET